MDAPGLSLFQGADSIKVNTSLNRIEEEEAIEDQKRRNEELRNQLQNAFDDLIDDDDGTVEGSMNFQSRFSNGHDLHNGYANSTKGTPSPIENFRENVDYKSNANHQYDIDRLSKIIESKDREIENISKMVHDERKKNDELNKRIALSEAEKERAHMSRKQTHELLVESKEKISDLEENISKLKMKIKNLENNNNELVGELEKTKMMLSDAQHKYFMVERKGTFAMDRNADNILKQTKERYSAQMDMMQQQIQTFREKFEEKETEYKTLDTKYKELLRSREALLIEKTETINQLARNLEESQKHCQHLIGKEDHSQENMRLQRLINAFEKQTESMQKTIDDLQSRLETASNELQLVESVICENEEDFTENFRRFSLGKQLMESTPLGTRDRLVKLKEEIIRSVNGQKEKREEIRRLRDQLANKNEEIRKLKEDENAALVKLSTYKEENIRLNNRIVILEAEIKANRFENSICDREKAPHDELEQEIKKLQNKNYLLEQEIANTKKENEISKELSESLKLEIDKLHRKLKSYSSQGVDFKKLNSSLQNLSLDYEELKQECDTLKRKLDLVVHDNNEREKDINSLKLDLEKHKFLLKDSQNECNRLKNLYIEISNSKDLLTEQLAEIKANDLNRELYVQKEKCVQLERALQLAEMKCCELEKSIETLRSLHEKSNQELREKFEKDKIDYMKTAKDSINNCTKCLEHVSEVTKFEIQNLKLQDQCTNYAKELNDLRVEFQDAKLTISDLNQMLSLKEEQDKLIADLQEKSRQFEEYVKNQNSAKNSIESTTPKQNSSRDQSVETSPELEQNHNRQQIESRVRADMAKVFAVEMKNFEDNVKKNFGHLEREAASLRVEYQKTKYGLQLRQNEVDILKHAILAEREKMEQILKTKDSESQSLLEKHTKLLEKCRAELLAKNDQIESLLQELNERSSQFELERQSMKAIVSHCEEERKTFESKEADLKKRYNNIVEQLEIKLNSSRKTCNNYKKYAEDKEKFMLQEYDRLKAYYEDKLAEMELKTTKLIEKYDQRMKNKIEEMQSKNSTKIV